jgi:hypothetical protein
VWPFSAVCHSCVSFFLLAWRQSWLIHWLVSG